jgi:hypothetical protein
MNSKRWVLSALLSCLPLAAGSAAACKKDRAASEPPSAEASAKGAEVPSPSPVAEAPSPSPAAEAPAPADTAGGAPAAGAPPADVVALGGGGKAKVAPSGGGKTVADTPSYTVTLAAPAKVGKGAQASVLLEVHPKAGWKLNKEFPTKLTVNEPAGVKVAKKEQTVADAVSFAEKSGKWQVQFQADSPGGKDFTGVLKFAVCTETSCDPKKEQLAWNVAVGD